ncbi:unnamed protein product, partial [Amoebophrya sp. A25]
REHQIINEASQSRAVFSTRAPTIKMSVTAPEPSPSAPGRNPADTYTVSLFSLSGDRMSLEYASYEAVSDLTARELILDAKKQADAEVDGVENFEGTKNLLQTVKAWRIRILKNDGDHQFFEPDENIGLQSDVKTVDFQILACAEFVGAPSSRKVRDMVNQMLGFMPTGSVEHIKTQNLLIDIDNIPNDEKWAHIQLVRENGFVLYLLPQSARSDKDTVLEAVQSEGQSLEYVSHDLRADKDVVEEAVTSDGE